jgi:hypothetical protein
MPAKRLSPERQALREKLDAVPAAREAVTHAHAVADAAAKALDEARHNLAQFSSIDQEIPQQRLEVLKGGDPRRLEELKEMQRRRILAREELAGSESTQALAASELVNAQDKLKAAETECAAAAVSVMSEHVAAVIAELRDIDQRRERLRMTLMGVGLPRVDAAAWARLTPDQIRNIVVIAVTKAGLPAASAEQWQAVHREIADALMKTESAQPRKPDDAMIAETAEGWKAFSDALSTDPAAEVGPSILPNARS